MAEINVQNQSTDGTNSSTPSDTKSIDITTDSSAGSESSSSGPQPGISSDPMLNSSGAQPSTNISPDKQKDKAKKEPADMKPKTFKPKTGMISFLRLVVEVLLAAIIIIVFMQNKTLNTDKTNLSASVSNLQQSAARAQETQNNAETAVGKLVPSLAGQTAVLVPLTTTNLTGQTAPLFTGAASGDQLLIYLKGDQAVIYSPSTDKLVSQSTLQFTTSSSTSSASTTTTKS